jgi:C1A family cysteine protease
MGSLVLCGTPPARYWPYTDDDPEFDAEPSSFVYSVADNYQAVKYFGHDPVGAAPGGTAVLDSVKEFLAAGIPAMFGFWGFPSFDDGAQPGDIPFPCPGENAEWGHAIVAVGYDDDREVTNTRCNQTETGALFIRNSWGTGWGEQGYGWMPYEYVRRGLATDFWSLISADWVATKEFGL